MHPRPSVPAAAPERGMSLIELLMALVILAIGILAVGRLFPAGSRAQVQDRLLTGANYYAQEQVEKLTGLTWADPQITDGRHPAGSACDTLGSGQWLRFYQVTTMTNPLDNLKKVDVTVSYQGAGQTSRSVIATTYVRR